MVQLRRDVPLIETNYYTFSGSGSSSNSGNIQNIHSSIFSKMVCFEQFVFVSLVCSSLIPSINFISLLNRHYVKMRPEPETRPENI